MAQQTEASVWIDDTELQSLGVTVTLDSEEPMLPEFRTSTVTIPGRHGAYDFGGDMDVRNFALNCVFQRQSYTDLKAQIRDFVKLFVDNYGRPKTVKLRFGDEPDKYYDVKLGGGLPIERLANLGFFTLQLVAYDPFAKFLLPSDEIIMDSEVWIQSPNIIWDTGLSSREIRNATSFEIINNGNTTVRFSFKVSGSAGSVSFSTNGKTLTLGTFSGKTIEIDGDNYDVKVGGVSDLTIMTGDFIELLPGYNTINVSGTSLNITVSESLVYKYA